MPLTIMNWLKMTEVDSFEDGCDPSSARVYSFDLLVNGDTPSQLKARVAGALCCDEAAITLDACDEPGRIDVQITENEAGYEASKRELEQWRDGKLKLWAATYTGYAVRMEPAGSLLALAS